MCYLQPSIEVVGKVSLLLPYHIFFRGATEIPEKNTFWPLHTDPPLSLQMLNANKQFMPDETQHCRGGGEGKVKWTNLTSTSVYGCSSGTAPCKGPWSKNLKLKNIVDETPNYQNKGDQKLMIRSIIRTTTDTESGIRAKFFSWSAIHGAFQIRESASFVAKIRNPGLNKGQIRRSVNLFTPVYTESSHLTTAFTYRVF